jgi:hypothetical protein
LIKCEALLACGANGDAEASALDAAMLAVDADDLTRATQAMRLWTIARFRQGKALASPTAERLLAKLPRGDASADLIRYWAAALGDRQVCAPDPGTAADISTELDALVGVVDRGPVEVPLTDAAAGTIWAELNAICARVNGTSLPMVFVDSGAQHTVMTRRAARSAGVQFGGPATQLVGFSGVDAQPAVLDSLDLGGLVLRNVPVLVGDSPALVEANGQMAIGTELMHHVRFTLDYPKRRVLAEYAARPTVDDDGSATTYIPLWTFSQACLTRAELPRGMARVLVDTGNRRGTYVAAAWARRHVSTFRRPTSTLVFKFRHRGLSLDTMELGSLTLADWPIWDRIPAELERLDVVDVLVGRDLLWQYRVTFDLSKRAIRLDGGPQSPSPPGEPLP